MALIDKSERIDFVGLDLQGEENFTEKDMYFHDDVKEAVLKLISLKKEDLIDAEEYFKLHKDNLMTMEEIEEHNENIYSDIFDIEKIFGDFK